MASRRGKGEGTIFKRADGRWVAIINLGYENGKRKRKSFYGRTRREVQEQLAATLRDLQQGVLPDPGKQTVGQFLTHWLEESARQSVRPATYRSYRDIIKLHLIPELGRTPLAKVTPQNIQTLITRKLESGLSPRRVQYIRAVLRRALGQAVKWGMVARNVATLVESPRVPRYEVQPYSPEQVRMLLQAVKGERLEALYVAAVALGMRQGELLGLRWEDVNLATRSVRITATLQRFDGKLQRVEPKTARSRRTLRLPEIVVVALDAHRRRQLEERMLAGPQWKDSGLVFTTSVGTPFDAPNVTHDFQRILKRAGLPGQRFHDLRHTCTSLMLAESVPARMIMEILGHSQISMTMDIYSHIMPALHKEAAERMDALLG